MRYNLNDVYTSANRQLFTFADFFAGGGGASTGLKLAGGKEVFCNEFIPDAIDTFKMNYPDSIVLPNDIRTLTKEVFDTEVGQSAYDLDIITGSPPCSAFSMSGKRDKGWGKEKKYSDTKQKNVEELFFDYINVIDILKPKTFIAENVVGITVGEAKKYLYTFINRFEDIGYTTIVFNLKASDHGVAQLRERCFLIGVRNDVLDRLNMTSFDMSSLIPMSRSYKVNVGDAINDIDSSEHESDKELLFQAAEKYFYGKFFKHLEKNSDKNQTPADPKHRDWNPKGSFFNFIRCSEHLPSPTLAVVSQQLSASGVVHYAEDRKFTIAELKRLFALPDDYILTGDFDKKAERICRMIAPFVIQDIGESIYNNIIRPYNDNK